MGLEAATCLLSTISVLHNSLLPPLPSCILLPASKSANIELEKAFPSRLEGETPQNYNILRNGKVNSEARQK